MASTDLQDINVHLGVGFGTTKLMNSSGEQSFREEDRPTIPFGVSANLHLRLFDLAAGLWYTATEMAALVLLDLTFGIDDDFDRPGTINWVLQTSGFTSSEWDTGPSRGQIDVEISSLTDEFETGIGVTDDDLDVWWEWLIKDGAKPIMRPRIQGKALNSSVDSGLTPPSTPALFTLVANNPPKHAGTPTGADIWNHKVWIDTLTDTMNYTPDSSTIYEMNMRLKP